MDELNVPELVGVLVDGIEAGLEEEVGIRMGGAESVVPLLRRGGGGGLLSVLDRTLVLFRLLRRRTIGTASAAVVNASYFELL